MERYHRINPDLVKQIVEMAKDEQKNRFEIEQKKLELAEKESQRADEIVKINKRNSLLGMISALFIVFLFLSTIAFLGWLHEPVAASVIGVIGAVIYYLFRGIKVEKP